MKTKTLRVTTLTGNAPFESLDASGNLQGYDIDIVAEIAKRMGVKVEYTKTDSAGRVTSLQSGKADMVVGSFTNTPERSQVIAFSEPINIESNALIAKADRSKLTKSEDLNSSDIKIASTAGGTSAQDVPASLPKAKLVLLPGMADVLASLKSGKVDAAAVSSTQVNELVKESGGAFKALVGTIGDPQNDCIGLPKKDTVWQEYVNKFVRQLNEDGTNYTLNQKYFGIEPPAFAKAP
jgi:ABC-type amino acid transport substrate-binding protein